MVQWQVVEIPSGFRVVTATSSSCPPSFTLPSMVDPAKTFLLKTLANGSVNFDDEDTNVLTLTGPTTVTASRTLCEGVDVQAVEWDGVTVTRGDVDGGLAPGVARASLLGLSPPASPQRAVLVQAGTLINGMPPMCGMVGRAWLPGPGEVAFSRAMADGGCSTNLLDRVEYERIDFGTRATVQERSLVFNPGVSSMVSTITAVDSTRTFVFASNQSAFGQSLGETSYPLAVPANVQEAIFSFELTTPTTVTVRRLLSASSAALTFYVVQVE